MRELFHKSQIPNPKLQIPKLGFGICVLGFGIWVLGFGIFAYAQEQRGSLGTVGALGQEVKRPPARTEPAPRLPDGTVSFDGVWVGGGPVNDIAQGLPKGEKLPLLPPAMKLLADRAQHETDDPHLWCMFFFIAASEQYTQNVAFHWKVILLMLAGANYLVLTVYDEAWALPASADAPLSGKLLGASALVLSIGVMYFGRMLPFIGNAF